MSKWFLSAKRADFEEIGKNFGISPVLARIIRNRDMITEEEIEKYLKGGLGDLYDPYLLFGLRQAVEILQEKINQGASIRVIGDYDVDGICATYILKKGLWLCGAKVDRVIPHRIKDGYGINEQLIQEAYEEGIDTIITCDNGIAAMEPIILAKKMGMTCIITDHHEVPFEETEEEKKYKIPPADVVIDPKIEECKYPFKKICGAVVAWKLVTALLDVFQVKEEERGELLELAGFATICDVMELKDENRIIVKEALKSMSHTKNKGLEALLKVYEITPDSLSAYHIGFVLGPCFNATGRLDTAIGALELLECEKEREAIFLAAGLRDLNESRKEMTEQGMKEAIEQVETMGYNKDKVMVVYLPHCHESLAGIIAGRIREKYSRPAFVLTDGEEGVKGSGRSMDCYHMYEEMTRCKELFTKYGGHKLAAGLSMERENVDIFRKRMNENCKLEEEEFQEKILIDIALPLSYVTKDFLKELDLLEPFGMGNQKPVFAQKEISFLSMRIMGKNKDMAKFVVEDKEQNRFQLVLFRKLDEFLDKVEEKYGRTAREALYAGRSAQTVKMNIIYYPNLNCFMGKEEIQFIMQHWN